MDGIAFEWDRKKDSANRRKHGVGFAEASTVFADPLQSPFRTQTTPPTKSGPRSSDCPAGNVCGLWFILLGERGSV